MECRIHELQKSLFSINQEEREIIEDQENSGYSETGTDH
jgi:hypothetical protein